MPLPSVCDHVLKLQAKRWCREMAFASQHEVRMCVVAAGR